MTDFELGIRRALAIYTAGSLGKSVPYYTGMRVADVEQLYTSGYMDLWMELDKETVVDPAVARVLHRVLTGDPKMAADLAAYRAAVAAKR